VEPGRAPPAKAHLLKERVAPLWDYTYEGAARRFHMNAGPITDSVEERKKDQMALFDRPAGERAG
jgi:hypothetical protein